MRLGNDIHRCCHLPRDFRQLSDEIIPCPEYSPGRRLCEETFEGGVIYASRWGVMDIIEVSWELDGLGRGTI